MGSRRTKNKRVVVSRFVLDTAKLNKSTDYVDINQVERYHQGWGNHTRRIKDKVYVLQEKDILEYHEE